MKDKSNPTRQFALREAMRWWSWALFPVVLGVLPVKEFGGGSTRWYHITRLLKVILLWTALGLILVGAVYFAKAVPESFSS